MIQVGFFYKIAIGRLIMEVVGKKYFNFFAERKVSFFKENVIHSQSEWFYRIQFAKQIEYVKTIFSQSELFSKKKKIFILLQSEIMLIY